MALIFSFLFCQVLVQPVKSQFLGSIYINPDGSVTGTDKIQRNGNIYTFTDNINGAIAIDKDNIVIDGTNHTLSGPSQSQYGISLLDRNGITIKNVQVSGFSVGIWLAYASNNTIYGNTATVEIDFNSTNNNITQNYLTSTASNSYFGIKIDCFGFSIYSNNVITNNVIANNPDGIVMYQSANNTITENTIANSTNDGLDLQYCSFNTIARNNIINNTRQVAGTNSGNNTWGMNYWSDHIDGGPYLIQYGTVLIGGINYTDVDYHPASIPFSGSTVTIPEFPSWIILPLILIATLSAILLIKRGKFKSN